MGLICHFQQCSFTVSLALRKALKILVTDVSFINCCGRMTFCKNGLLLCFLLLGKQSALVSPAKWAQGTLFSYTTIALRIMTFTELILEALLANVQCRGIYPKCVPLRFFFFFFVLHQFSGVKLAGWVFKTGKIKRTELTHRVLSEWFTPHLSN